MANLDLASEPPPLAAQMTSTWWPSTISKCTTAGVLSLVFCGRPPGRPAPRRAAGCPGGVGAADAFVDHLLDAHRRIRPGDLHADLDEDHADASILADRAVAFGGHARVGQDLGDGVLGGGLSSRS